ncbi:PREDICTED: uncharacterized protein LOC109582527 [Amphimedon queenslandica]|uniref:Protein kinase domain-containing protein n=1 Tax=Amphimedon queenslandica TaxID=400682 RepID=A0AAN0J807_AMPQE|nr:PREDICTED: uncharacterized protein LOC109582527 [Amphimedon queenslandica]|eukprot:XP_019852828.1 PREDICTED: uncharacterized protein LOC109582527 [Amphimedon queenslandica]
MGIEFPIRSNLPLLSLQCALLNLMMAEPIDAFQQLKEKVQHLLLDRVEETTKELGRGSYGAVIELKVDGKKCAGKKLHNCLVASEPCPENDYQLGKFGDEIILQSQVDHPNIVKLLGVHYSSGSQLPMLVMEFLPHTLVKLLGKDQDIRDDHDLDPYSVLLDVAIGLSYLHSQQPPIIHRDLTASNVLLTEDYNTAKISDLGVSLVSKERHKRLTQTPGNFHIMPPEAFLHNPVYNEKLDIFSFGCLILHMLTGQLPALPVDQSPSVKAFASQWERRVHGVVEKVLEDSPVGLVSLAKQCLSDDPPKRPNIIEVFEILKASNEKVLEPNLYRRNSHILSKNTYEKEYVSVTKRSTKLMYLHFKTKKNGQLKLTYDMKTCVGVRHRKNLDRAKRKWPHDADPKCCFKVTDQDKAHNLYLIADNEYVAQEWVKELKRYVNMNNIDKRKGEFSVDDLQELYDTLAAEEGSLPWDKLGASLGLVDSTIKQIERCCLTEENCLKECLSHWLKWSDLVDDKGGPTCENLKEALKLVGKEEIANRIDGKFSQTRDTESSAQDVKMNESIGRSTKKRFGRDRQYTMHASVPDEAYYLSHNKRSFSSLVVIANETPATIIYHTCFIARGHEGCYVGFDNSVPPGITTSYCFEKCTSPSEGLGCAAMIFFSATTCEPEPVQCFFVVAFRNYTIKLRKPNKTALMILSSSKSINELFDLLHYDRIIDNEKENPSNLPGCYIGDKYPTTFMSTGRGDKKALTFSSIEFHMTMDSDNDQSFSTVTVSHPKN